MTLTLASVAVVLGSFAAQLLFSSSDSNIGVLRSVWLGVCAMWLVMMTVINGRANVARASLHVVLVVGLVCVYWDYLTGWHGWSLTYTVPILCGCAVIAVLITVRTLKVEVGDHVLYSLLLVVLGLTSVVFLLLGWVNNPWAALSCALLSAAVLGYLQFSRGREIRHELSKRLHL